MRIYDFPRLISWARLSIFWPPKIPCFNTSLEEFLEAVFFADYFSHHTKIYFSKRVSINLQKSSTEKIKKSLDCWLKNLILLQLI